MMRAVAVVVVPPFVVVVVILRLPPSFVKVKAARTAATMTIPTTTSYFEQ